jgi:hypothetical protein
VKYIDIRVPTKNENIVWLGSCSHMQILLYLYVYVAYPQRTASTLHSSRTDSVTYEPGLNRTKKIASSHQIGISSNGSKKFT